MPNQPAPARPSASVLIVRDGAESLEVLLLRRNEKVVFHGGAWVFPGGRVDKADGSTEPDAELTTARRAAARETMEEAGLHIDDGALLPFAHWTTPLELPKRFATWFFAAAIEAEAQVRIDASEIVDHRWMSAPDALRQHLSGELSLPGPTFVTLLRFKAFRTSQELREHVGATDIQRFVPRLAKLPDGRCALYSEDAGYDTLDLDAPGPRHRLVMRGTDWQYLNDF